MFTPPFTIYIAALDHVRVTTTSPGSLDGMYSHLVSNGFDCDYEGGAIIIRALWHRVMASLVQYGE